MPATIWIPALLLFAAAAFGTLGLVLVWEIGRDWWERRAVRRQLEFVLSPADRADDDSQDRPQADLLRLKALGADDIEGWAAAARSLPIVRSSLALIEQADVGWSPLTLYLLMLGGAVALGGMSLVLTGSLFVSLLFAGFGSLLPYLYLRRRHTLLARAFEQEFPEALDLLTRAVRAGHPLSSGLRMVAEEGPDRVADEFGKSFEEHRFGLSFEDALLGMVDRVGIVDVRIFATAVLIQRESGGNLAEILDKLGSTIRDRFTIRRQLRVYTAQGRLSGYTLAALPIIVGSLIYLIEPSYVGMLFEETIGQVLLAAALILQIMGYFWIRKIVDIEI